MTGTTHLALANLTSPAVLAFILGLIVVFIKSPLKVPTAIVEVLSIYLLIAIGLKGGVALTKVTLAEFIGPLLLAIGLGIAIPLAVFFLLRLVTKVDAENRGAIAAHYGSTSLVTFTAGLVFLEQSGLVVEGYLPSLLAIMEVPGIILGILLAKSGGSFASMKPVLHEVFTGKSIVLLVGGIIIGLITGPVGYEKVQPFFGELFLGFLVIFLLQLGIQAGESLKSSGRIGIGLIGFAAIFPLVIGSLGVVLAQLVGMGEGGSVAFGLICGSASYIAAPAAVKLSLPNTNPGYYLTTALGITFPVNLVVGIPLLAWVASTIV
jgi:hypothetical protein